jgi:hypothetical protein
MRRKIVTCRHLGRRECLLKQYPDLKSLNGNNGEFILYNRSYINRQWLGLYPSYLIWKKTEYFQQEIAFKFISHDFASITVITQVMHYEDLQSKVRVGNRGQSMTTFLVHFYFAILFQLRKLLSIERGLRSRLRVVVLVSYNTKAFLLK